MSDSITISEVHTRLTNLLRSLSDSIVITESNDKVMGFVRAISEIVDVSHFTGKIKREGFVRIRKIARLFRRGQSAKTYKRGNTVKGADR